MLWWTCKISLLSLLLIFLLHYLYTFFLHNLTSPKIKDLVNRPKEQYENMFNSINNTSNVISNIPDINNEKINNEKISKISNVKKGSKMKDELRQFLTSEMNNNTISNYQHDEGLYFSSFASK
jgi:hypothetical protein